MTTIDRRLLAVGTLLAEGGEGKVHELVDRPGELYKAYRRPVPLAAVAPLLAWRQRLEVANAGLAARISASTSWPMASVVDPSGPGGTVSGLVIPRAPPRFSIRHRDGISHLSTLSYLTADPRQRSAAYGLDLPAVASPARIALVYALARLLEAFAGGGTTLAHGDLSTKNVLWSLHPAPEVYLLDCDSGRLFGPEGCPLDANRRPHVVTPNWDDPAAVSGSDLGPLSDQYSLALIFLRVVGAGHYPIQARQKRGEPLVIDVEIPPWGRRAQRLSRDAEVWDLCGRGLSITHLEGRPDASAWVRVLEATLRDVGAETLIEAVCATQGGNPATAAIGPGTPAAARARRQPLSPPALGERDVTVRAITAEVRPEPWKPVPATRPPANRPVAGTRLATRPAPAAASLYRPQFGAAPVLSVVSPVGAAPTQEMRRLLGEAWRWWLLIHRRMARALRSSGRRGRGLRRLVFCVLTDFALACVGLFLIAMIVSPFLGI